MASPPPRAGPAGRAGTLSGPAHAPGGPEAGVAIVLVHHDQPARCAASVRAFRDQAGVGSVLVVDTGSAPGALAELRRRCPGLSVLETGANIGFGPGANAGIRHWLATGRGDWVGVAPHDALPDPGCVATLVAVASATARAGLASAEFGPGYDLVPVYDKVLGGYHRPSRRGRGWQDVAYPHGTLLLARRAALEEVGLFDERYFAYCEEVDLGLRAAAAGWRVGLVWGAVVRNGAQPARPVADYLQLRNTLLLVGAHETRREVRARVLLAVAALVAGALRRPGTARTAATVTGQALRDHRRGRYGPPPARIVALARATESVSGALPL